MKIIGLLLVSLLLVSCGPESPTGEKANEYINKMVFIKHTNGYCFGVVSFVTYYGYIGVSVTSAPDGACK